MNATWATSSRVRATFHAGDQLGHFAPENWAQNVSQPLGRRMIAGSDNDLDLPDHSLRQGYGQRRGLFDHLGPFCFGPPTTSARTGGRF